MSGSGDSEAKLMARLNALRQSSSRVSDDKPSAASEDALSKRLNALRRASSGYNDEKLTITDSDNIKDIAANTISAGNDDFNKEELRDDLVDLVEASQGARLSKQDLEEARTTLELAGNLLRAHEPEDIEHQGGISKNQASRGHNPFSDSPVLSATEEDIDRLLEELNMDSNSANEASPGVATPGSSGSEGEAAGLKLPDAPTTLSQTAKANDDISLPSVPSLAPRTSTTGAARSFSALRHTSGSFRDAEVDTWCIICCDDAVLRCVGCDGDLYCVNCWVEGHRGQDAGHEERGHKAVTFTRETKKPQKALA